MRREDCISRSRSNKHNIRKCTFETKWKHCTGKLRGKKSLRILNYFDSSSDDCGEFFSLGIEGFISCKDYGLRISSFSVSVREGSVSVSEAGMFEGLEVIPSATGEYSTVDEVATDADDLTDETEPRL